MILKWIRKICWNEASKSPTIVPSVYTEQWKKKKDIKGKNKRNMIQLWHKVEESWNTVKIFIIFWL